MKKLYILLLVMLSMIPSLKASHFMGGEIWWDCLSNGKYIFHARLYQECYGILYNSNETLYTTVPGLMNIPLLLVDSNDLTPVCNNNLAFPHLNCDLVNGPNTGSIREWLYISDTITLPSTAPPAAGWVFSIDICNRNNCTNILNASNYCGYIRAIMHSYNNMPANPCYDNSSFYAERPVFVGPTGIPQSINHFGFDVDGDSLGFEWVPAWTDNNTPIPMAPDYSYDSPLPGTVQNPNNIPVALDPLTGAISFTSFTSGAFVTAIKTSSYRNGILLSEVIREEQFVLVGEGENYSPEVSAPFPQNLSDPWTDTINWGDTVHFQLQAIDTGYLNDTISAQSVSYTASSLFFGNNYSDTGCCCPVPPCATLTPVPPSSSPVSLSLDFNWYTTYLHLLYGNIPTPNFKEYYFSFNFADDYCPVPARTTKTVKIVMRNPSITAPALTNYEIDPNSGILTFHWTPVQDTNQYFDKYYIYYKSTEFPDFEFHLLDSVSNINQSFYSLAQPLLSGEHFWVYLKTRTKTNLSSPSNILTNSTIGIPVINTSKESLSLQFNTANQSLVLQGNANTASEVSVQLFDCLGVTHFTKNVMLQSGINKSEIRLNTLTPGVYFYTITGLAGKYTGKVLIIK